VYLIESLHAHPESACGESGVMVLSGIVKVRITKIDRNMTLGFAISFLCGTLHMGGV